MIQAIICMGVGVAAVLIYQAMIPTDDAILIRNIRRSIRARIDRDTGRVDHADAYGLVCDIQDKIDAWRG